MTERGEELYCGLGLFEGFLVELGNHVGELTAIKVCNMVIFISQEFLLPYLRQLRLFVIHIWRRAILINMRRALRIGPQISRP